MDYETWMEEETQKINNLTNFLELEALEVAKMANSPLLADRVEAIAKRRSYKFMYILTFRPIWGRIYYISCGLIIPQRNDLGA